MRGRLVTADSHWLTAGRHSWPSLGGTPDDQKRILTSGSSLAWIVSMKRTWCGHRGHDQGVGAHPLAEEADAPEEGPVGDARGREDDVLAGGQVLGAVDLVEVRDAHLASGAPGPTALVSTSLAWISPFRQRMAAAVRTPSGAPPVPITAWTPVPDHRGRDAGREVAVPDEPDPRPRLADVGDQPLVARSVEDDDHQVVDLAVEAAGDRLEVVLHRGVDVDLPLGRVGPTTSFSM